MPRRRPRGPAQRDLPADRDGDQGRPRVHERTVVYGPMALAVTIGLRTAKSPTRRADQQFSQAYRCVTSSILLGGR